MGNLQVNFVMPQSHVMFVKVSRRARGHPAIGISSFKENSAFRSGVESKRLFCNYLFGAWFCPQVLRCLAVAEVMRF